MNRSLLIVCFGIGLFPVSLAQERAPAPAKVVRYAKIMIERYDLNGDGILQQDEWEKMSGLPRAIDIDGDKQITQEELVWHLSRYGQSRTIHRPVVSPVYEPFRYDPTNLRFFTPTLPLVSASPVSDPAATLGESGGGLEEMIQANEQLLDDDVYQKMLEENQIPSSRPYHVLPETLRGVPAWFIMLDKNGDGQISLQEFAPTRDLRAIMLFKKYDTNGNWFIEPDEVREH